MHSAEYWIEKLKLESHPEGGFFRQTYKSAGILAIGKWNPEVDGNRSFSTAIYFLLDKNTFSAFHRIKSDEMWHFYKGKALEVFYIDSDGSLVTIKLGRDFEQGEVFQASVPANCWFGSKVCVGAEYALVGCTVAPGFEFEDFEMADRNSLLTLYPQHRDIILQLTH